MSIDHWSSHDLHLLWKSQFTQVAIFPQDSLIPVMVLFSQISSVCLLPIPLTSLISGIIFSLPTTINVNLATWFKRCAKESLLIHPFVYSFVHSTNICCSRHQRYSVEKIRQRTHSPKLFSRVLTKRQTLVRKLPLWALMLLVPLYLPSEKLFTPSQRIHASYIMVNKFYMCQMPPHPPNSHSLPCRLLQEVLEKNVNGHIFLSK